MTDPELRELDIGDHVTDREDDESATMLVVGYSPKDASEYELEAGGPTVADVNPGHPQDDDVVEVSFPTRTDVDVSARDRYGYPRSRLEVASSIHDRSETDGDSSE